MKTFSLASMFLPQSASVLLVALAGLFLIIGQRSLAWSMIALVLTMAFSPMFDPLLDELFTVMPWWLLVACVGGLAFMFAGRFLRDVLVQVTGDLIASAIRTILGSRIALLTTVTVICGLWGITALVT